jgi:soluble lytic murein transglycosylase-like protein
MFVFTRTCIRPPCSPLPLLKLTRRPALKMNLSFALVPFLVLALAIPCASDSAITACNPAPLEKPTRQNLIALRMLIEAMAQKHQVPAEFVKSIMAAESNFNSDAVSPKGAIGLMQLMPETAREWGADPRIPEQNVEAGTRYLRFLMQRYRNSRKPLACAIAAYNAGPGAVDRFHGVPPFRETRGYVARVLSLLRRFRRRQDLAQNSAGPYSAGAIGGLGASQE